VRIIARIAILMTIVLANCCEASTKSTITPGLPLDQVRLAISEANAGDTIILPSGSAIWDDQLVITKNIILKAKTPGGTTITSNYSAPHLGNPNEDKNYLIVYRPSNPAAKELFRLSGFVFNMASKCLGLKLGNSSTTAVDQLRIDNNKFSNSPGRSIFITGTVYGVIDSNEFTGRGAIIGVHGLASTSWNNLTFDFGTADNIYVEDNVFNITDTAHDGGVGGRYCVRHNIYNFTNASAGLYPFCDMHGNDPAANPSGMGVEIYENIVNILSPGMGMTIFDHRGGKALLYNNNVITTGSVTTKCQEEHPDSDNPPASSPISGQPQHVSDSYYWGNRKNGTIPVYAYIAHTVDYGLLKGVVPQENREFWDENPSFDGTTGIGIGRLANRPITCKKGVGYWATDTNTLYRCTATNNWEAYYTPYAYPHPLRRLP
jgi:hypothetical protein